MPRMYYIANARMPTEKAHGIQIAKMCEAFIEAGVDLVLVVPSRKTDERTMREYYGLRTDVPLVRLWAIDWYTGGRLGYLISSLSFMCSYVLFVLRKKLAGEHFVLYTVDVDNYSYCLLIALGMPLFCEMHGAKPASLAQRLLFSRLRGAIAINSIIAEELKASFPRSPAHFLVEPNGVDLAAFPGTSKSEARAALGLPQEVPMVLYAGRFFEWKGLEILPKAAERTPHICWQTVGGSEAHFKEFVREALPSNLFFAGSRPYTEMPLWLAAADALLVLGTKRDIQSYRYTSPMKLFEYLAADRPIIASRTPALSQVVSEREVLWYEPDSAESFAEQVRFVATHPAELSPRLAEAKKLAKTYTWKARAERVKQFITEHIHG